MKNITEKLTHRILKETLEDRTNDIMEKLKFNKPGKSFDYVEESECMECGGEMSEGECMECGYSKMNEGETCECGSEMREGECMECGMRESEVMEKLYGGQKKLDKAKPFGKLTKADFDKLRKEGDEVIYELEMDEENINEGVELLALGPIILQLYAAFLLTRNMSTEVDDSGQVTDWWIKFKKRMSGVPKKVKDFVSSIPDRIENGVDEIKFQLNKKELSKDADEWLRENIENDSELQSKMKNLQDDAKDYNEKINQLNDKLNMNDYFKERYKGDKSQESQLLSPEKINKYKQTEESLKYKLKYINKKKNDLAEIVEEKIQKLKEELPNVYRIVIGKFTEMAKYDNFEKNNNDIIYELELDEEMDESSEFSYAARQAKKQGKKSFELDGKKFPVKESYFYNLEIDGNETILSESELDNLIMNIVEKEESKTNNPETKYKLEIGGRGFIVSEEKLLDIIEKAVLKEENNISKGSTPKGYGEYERSVKKSKKENDDYIKSVGKKMKDYLKDGSKGDYDMNPKFFPKGNGQLEKMKAKKYTMSDDGKEFLDDYMRPGMENLVPDEIEYDEKWVSDNIKGSSRTGNNPEWANAEETELGERLTKKMKDQKYHKAKLAAYRKSKQPVTDGTGENSGSGLKIKTESKIDRKRDLVLEEFAKIQKLINYDRVTQ